MTRSELRWAAIAALAVALLSSLPYVVVAATTPADVRFGGALITPIDAQSYFAKMRQGYDGAWLFRLPYTVNDEADAFVYTFFLALGHLARLTGLSLTAVYHLARGLGGWALLMSVYALIARVFDRHGERRRAWLFVALTSGLGWIGLASTDVSIPESNTFFSILTNPHFPASMALMLIIYMSVLDGMLLRASLASLGLAILQPFAPIAVFVGLLMSWIVGWSIGHRRASLWPQVKTALIAGLSIAPLMIYFYLAVQGDPVLRGWSAQNLTPSPPLSEYLIGYGLIWLLAIPGARAALRRRRDVDVLLVAWALSSALLLYAPFPLQRRFSLGLHIPLVLLAVMGLRSATAKAASGDASYRWWGRIAFIFSLPTTLLLMAIMSTATMRPPDGRLFFSANEAAAFDWLRLAAHAPRKPVVIAAPETGLFLPAWADVRVIYGHPFETLDAAETRSKVESFFAGTADRTDMLRGVDYIFFGPREKKLGEADPGWQPVFESGDVTIYAAP
ncbi:MAG TPA: hypothetical protein VJ754_09925 [Anaerolineae bacterium]|nr:hypothetical protein [Anaerolineae bacterium]